MALRESFWLGKTKFGDPYAPEHNPSSALALRLTF